ncbi:MAG: hypothetical protein OXF93_22600 [Acidobacteria bacterium]|nr:hypothetical protein [Acidobacteriota bacterium]
MRHTLIAFALTAFPAIAVPAGAGQQGPVALTNTDVLLLTEARLSTTVILAKIEVTRTDFDTSVDALIALAEAGVDPAVLIAMMQTPDSLARGIDFGDDTGDWAHDEECDDPRFRGAGMADVLSHDDRGRDASDCRQLFESGLITLRNGPEARN